MVLYRNGLACEQDHYPNHAIAPSRPSNVERARGSNSKSAMRHRALNIGGAAPTLTASRSGLSCLKFGLSCATNSRNFGDNEVSSYRGARHLFVPAQPEALALGDLGQMV